jgi:hypothetical protein
MPRDFTANEQMRDFSPRLALRPPFAMFPSNQTNELRAHPIPGKR